MNESPEIYYLSTVSPFIDPRWLGRVSGKQFDVAVSEDMTVTIEDQKLRFMKQDHTLPPGTEITVWLDRYFKCAKQEDLINWAKAKNQKHEEDEKKRIQDEKDRRNRYRDEAIALNGTIELPVKWDVGIKHVLSGLSQNSNGDGRSKATVEHIILLEDLEAGRIKRQRGSFLCSTDRDKDGKVWLGYKDADNGVTEFERRVDGEGNEYQSKVTCKACLQVAENIMKQKKKQEQTTARQGR